MRTLFSLTVAVLTLSLFEPSLGQAQEIKWYPDLQSATSVAAAENKLVLLHFTADWCRPCKTLESFVFQNRAVQRAFADNVIAVKIDVEEHPDLVQQYAVAKVPYDVALTATGRVVAKRKSPLNASSYHKMVSGYGAIIGNLATAQNPGLNQNLDEVNAFVRSEDVKFEGQTTSFTPNGPTHSSPRPSHESAELKRKSKFVSNPYTSKPNRKPQRVENAFVASPPKSQDNATSNSFKVVPNVIRNPIPSVDDNQFLPANADALASSPPEDPQPKPLADTKPVCIDGVCICDGESCKIEPGTEDNSFQPTMEAGEAQNQTFRPAENTDLKHADLMTNKPSTPLSAAVPFAPKSTSEINNEFVGSAHPPIESSTEPKQVATYEAKITVPEAPSETSKTENRARLILGQAVPMDSNVATIDSGSITSPSTHDTKQTSPASDKNFAQNELVQPIEPPTSEPQFALQGKCPVTLLTQSKWVDGDKQWGCIHRQRIYLFASEANLKRFQEDPDSFSPILAGYDPVVFHESGKLVDGLEEHGVFMGKSSHQRVVLFATAADREKFQKEPRKYLDTVRQAMQSNVENANLLR